MSNLNLQDAEDQIITVALAKADGDRGRAAKMLGIHIRTLWRKIKIRQDKDAAALEAKEQNK